MNDAPSHRTGSRGRECGGGVLSSFLMFTASVLAGCSGAPLSLQFEQAPALPDPVGFAGLGAGVCGDAIIAAGGANFPGNPPWEGGRKVFSRNVYVFEDGAWRAAGTLPSAEAYGAYCGTRDGLVLAGGTDDAENFRSVIRVSIRGGAASVERLPSLPGPVAFAACAEWQGKLVVIGGTDSPQATHALNSVYGLDLSNPEKGWTCLPAIPGRGRLLSVAGTFGDKLYLFGGCSLSPDAAGRPVRTFLKEAFVLDAENDAWRPVRQLPEPLVASVGPAPVAGDALLLLGGDTGFFHNNGKSPAEHPGQPKTIYAYRPGSDTYALVGELPHGIVTAPAVEWRGAVWLISGETGPGRRTNRVTVLRHPRTGP